jgi:hypothetical protein
MAREHRGTEALLAVSAHLFYEVKMLQWTMKALPGARDKFALNALLESFIIHARNLVHFLSSRNDESSDVLAEDFFGGDRKAWETIFAETAESKKVFRDVKRRASKELAHLTYDRLQLPVGGGKPWDPQMVGKTILDGIRLFLKRVDPSLLHSNWRAAEAGPRLPMPETRVPSHTGTITDPTTRYLT